MPSISVTQAAKDAKKLKAAGLDIKAKELIIIDGVEYAGTVRIIRMWTHYDGIK